MKKIFLLCAALLLLLAVAFAEEDKQVLSTPQDLFKIGEDPYGSFVLGADIDMSGVSWIPVEFGGTFDGEGHTIYNLSVTERNPNRRTTIDGNHKEYDTELVGFFAYLKNATVKNLNILGAEISYTSDNSTFAAVLTALSEWSTIENVNVNGRVYLYTGGKMGGVAGLVGFGNGTIDGCSADVTLVYVDTNTSVKCEEFLGGALACGYMNVLNTAVTIDGYASVHGYVHNGGVVGMHHDHNKSGYKSTITGCSIQGQITFFEHNTDRRAYCESGVGEKLNNNLTVTGNTEISFKSTETKDYKTTLLPEKCEQPYITDEVIAPTCTEFGYTKHICAGCGCEYCDSFTPPAHSFITKTIAPTCTEKGYDLNECTLCTASSKSNYTDACHTLLQPQTVVAPTYTSTGKASVFCAVCGELINDLTLDMLVRAQQIVCTAVPEGLKTGDEFKLNAHVLPENASDTGIGFATTNSKVASVDASGTVVCTGRGTAEIVAVSNDGGAVLRLQVTVDGGLSQFEVFLWQAFGF